MAVILNGPLPVRHPSRAQLFFSNFSLTKNRRRHQIYNPKRHRKMCVGLIFRTASGRSYHSQTAFVAIELFDSYLNMQNKPTELKNIPKILIVCFVIATKFEEPKAMSYMDAVLYERSYITKFNLSSTRLLRQKHSARSLAIFELQVLETFNFCIPRKTLFSEMFGNSEKREKDHYPELEGNRMYLAEIAAYNYHLLSFWKELKLPMIIEYLALYFQGLNIPSDILKKLKIRQHVLNKVQNHIIQGIHDNYFTMSRRKI